jgi:hypothetical protein
MLATAVSAQRYRCDEFDLFTADIEDVSIYDIQSNIDENGSETGTENCYPTLVDPEGVYRFSGVVTAIGRTSPPMFYMQDGNGPFSGMQVYDESHLGRVEVGDEVEVIGLSLEEPTFSISEFSGSGYGMTTIEGCSVVVTSKGNPVPEPVTIPAEIVNADDCNLEAEQWESMMVKIEDLEVGTCPNRLVGMDYPQCSANVDLDDVSTWDKYYQSWLVPAGAEDDSVILELENHMFTWIAKCLAIAGEPLDSVTGVLVWESHHSGFDDRSSWDLVPTSQDDIGGCVEIPSDQVIDLDILDLQQSVSKYGPTEWGAIPPEKLSVDIGGTAEFPGESCPPPEYMLGNDAAIQRTHNLCQCFPAAFYDPGAGSQGSGKARMILFIEGKCVFSARHK